jgi:predicted NUDIX family phosphoesterase
MSTQEKVLVVSRSLFDSVGSFQGLRANIEEYLPLFLNPSNHSFLERAKAEEDPNFKQIIPYIVITCGERVLHYRRGGGSGEKRLLKKRSLGIGGHINDKDSIGKDFDSTAYEQALRRELEEELDLPSLYSTTPIKPLALLNDDSNPVGAVHLGVVHHCVLFSEKVFAKEEAIAELGFFTHQELLEQIEEFETWSQMVIREWSNLNIHLKK